MHPVCGYWESSNFLEKTGAAYTPLPPRLMRHFIVMYCKYSRQQYWVCGKLNEARRRRSVARRFHRLRRSLMDPLSITDTWAKRVERARAGRRARLLVDRYLTVDREGTNVGTVLSTCTVVSVYQVGTNVGTLQPIWFWRDSVELCPVFRLQ